MILVPSQGFDPGPAQLPHPRFDVPLSSRLSAAAVLLDIVRGATPESVSEGLSAAARVAFVDPIELGEALAFVDALLQHLSPVPPVPRSTEATS